MTAPDGRAYWRALSQHSSAPEAAAGQEFPAGAAEREPDLSRRDFLALLGASAALATACTRQPREHILPYVTQPPEVTPGIPLHYATAMSTHGFATGLLVTSYEGRPTKIEGNPDHPASAGAAGVHEQASILGLYDPDRARAPRLRGQPTAWETIVAGLDPKALRPRVGTRGGGLHILLEPTSSPLLAALCARIRALYPDSGIHRFTPLAADGAIDAARALFGQPVQPLYDLSRADVIVALDADFLASGPFHLRYARDAAARRRIARPSDSMSRLYVAEPTPTPTGTLADHRLRARASDIAALLGGLFGRVSALGTAIPGASAVAAAGLGTPPGEGYERWLDAAAHDLRAAAGRGLVVVGPGQPPAVHAMAALLNAGLGNNGATLWHARSPIIAVDDAMGGINRGLGPLVDAIHARSVDTLVILEGNPVYTAPADTAFADALRRVPQSFYLGLYDNETARETTGFVPAAHFLESWGDARAYDGTLSVVQPLIAPLYEGRTPSEVLAALAGTPQDAHTLLRDGWHAAPATSGGVVWDDTLRRGLVPGSAYARTAPSPRPEALGALLAALPTPAAGMEVICRAAPAVDDGCFANNGWLQELPDPLTKLTWGNAALVSPAAAARLGVVTGDVVRVELAGRAIDIPALALPGQADGTVALHFGYGREGGERVARGVGVNVYPIWTTTAHTAGFGTVSPRVERGAPVRQALAITQSHWTLEGRPVVQQATLEEYRQDPAFTERQRRRTLSIYTPQPERGDQWAMTIDLSLCTGCSACVVACQAENNIPVVGAAGVRESREMHWLRIDRYFAGDPADPEIITQPMLCQQCEQAPCEYVCPVNATVHSDDGLNEMVYNRCVGTRFCSNNCPYKVRRFNWFDYNAGLSAPASMVENPNVTVRDRGVMEKCTFCVQRIRRAQIDAQLEGRPVHDGDVVTACQQACPTQVITFGSRSDPTAAVTERLAEPRGYAVLHDLGTEPRVRYLARISNPNSDLPPLT